MLEYEVQEGDCLWRINERFYGSGYEQRTIVRDGDAPKDPDEFVWLYCVRSDWIVLYFFKRENMRKLKQTSRLMDTSKKLLMIVWIGMLTSIRSPLPINSKCQRMNTRHVAVYNNHKKEVPTVPLTKRSICNYIAKADIFYGIHLTATNKSCLGMHVKSPDIAIQLEVYLSHIIQDRTIKMYTNEPAW